VLDEAILGDRRTRFQPGVDRSLRDPVFQRVDRCRGLVSLQKTRDLRVERRVPCLKQRHVAGPFRLGGLEREMKRLLDALPRLGRILTGHVGRR